MPYNEKANLHSEARRRDFAASQRSGSRQQREVYLINYLPPYYEDNEEIIRLTDAENPEVDGLWAAISETTDNQFIRTSGDKRIRQWERLLRLRPDYATQPLDYRKDIVIMRLSTRVPLTYRWLAALLTDIAGENRFAIDLRHNEYFIQIHLKERPDIGEDLWFHLRRSIPANLGLGFKYTVTNRVTSPYIAGLTAADSGRIFIPHPRVLSMRVKDALYGGNQPVNDIRCETIPPKLPGDVKINGAVNTGALPVTDRQRLRIPHRLPCGTAVKGMGFIGSGGLEYARIRIPTTQRNGNAGLLRR